MSQRIKEKLLELFRQRSGQVVPQVTAGVSEDLRKCVPLSYASRRQLAPALLQQTAR